LTRKSFLIDCFTESNSRSLSGYAAVAVDVIRSTTVAVTIVASGRRCFYAASVDTGLALANKFVDPLLVGEVGGNKPYGFDLNNSPVEIEGLLDFLRPVIIVSTSGTPLMKELSKCHSAYVACLRNYGAIVNQIVGRHNSVLIVGAPTRGEFREEDQLCCAWIGVGLINAGYLPEDDRTAKIVDKWKNVPVEVCAHGKSARYLRETGQLKDLDYILTHVNDLNTAFEIKDSEIVKTS
jgi:2-phosphosulfolactate phosphatase